jgi:outer membrane protein assembly factor BamB
MRLDGMNEIYASPVSAAGRIYITDRQGVTLVLDDDPAEPEVLARNVLDESISASAALVGDEIYLRGERHLYCIAVSDARGEGR